MMSTLYEGSTFIIKLPYVPPRQEDNDNNYMDVDNSRIINTMSIEFSDIYLFE